MTGIAETTPCENTNDPTPRSIYNYQTVKPVIECIPPGCTYQRDPVCFALGQRAGKHGKIHGKNREDGHQDHVGPIRRQGRKLDDR